MIRNLLLTGRPGCGKSTVIQRTLDLLHLKAGGFFTAEIQESGRRVGFSIQTLDGHSGVLAHINIAGPPRVSKYGVNLHDLETIAIPALQRACEEAELIVCDEIASMELCSPLFAEAVRAPLDCPKPVLGVIQQKRLPFLDEIRQRPDVRIVTVTAENRDRLSEGLAETLGARGLS